jgi:UDP-glucose 4-epimerase
MRARILPLTAQHEEICVINKVGSPSVPRWLVTGAGGRVGRMLWRHWQEDPPGAELLRQTRNSENATESDLFWAPLTQPLPTTAGKIDCLIAYAGITPAYGADLGLNADLAEATLAAAFEAGIGRVLLTSSSAVYGAPKGNAPLREDDKPNPVNDYGRSKLVMEEICAPWRARGMDICCLRIGNVAGADVLLLNGMAADKPLFIDRFDDGGGPLRSYIGPATLARITASLAAHPGFLPSHLNISAPVPVAMADLASAAGFAWTWQEAPATAHQRITLDLSRLEALYSFAPADSDPREIIDQCTRLRDPQ